MKIIGRMVGADDSTSRPAGDLLVSMTHEEWDIWRRLTGLTGASPDRSLVLNEETARAFDEFRYATEFAAKALGMVKP